MKSLNHIIPLSKLILPFNYFQRDYYHLIKDIDERHLILMGQATYGTKEFYKIRSELTKLLIQEKGVNAVAIEGDWPDVYHINYYIKNLDPSLNEYKALERLQRFPSWLWHNEEIVKFLKWLREYNDQCQSEQDKVSIFGLDLYSMHASMKLVVEYLEKIDPEAAEKARNRYECLQQYGDDPSLYGYASSQGLIPDCKEEVYTQLIEILKFEINALQNQDISQEELLFLVQNARVVANAEAYYRSFFKGPELTWNLRTQHMIDTLETLRIYLQRKHGCYPRIVIWAHNSHVGDARATQLFELNQINLGQMVRDIYGFDAYLLGFSTYEGEVTSATHWGGEIETKHLMSALEGSYEHLFHFLSHPNFLLLLRQNLPITQPSLQRAVGVIYKPETEYASHYHLANLALQFDAILHIDTTRAVNPLFMP